MRSVLRKFAPPSEGMSLPCSQSKSMSFPSMTQDQAVEMLKGGKDGIAEWNRLRQEVHDGSYFDWEQGNDIPSLGGANFRNTDLTGADLTGARLIGAHFFETNLTETEFYKADLTKADFSYAILKGTNLDVADLKDARLNGVIYDRDQMKCRGIRLGGCYGNPIFKRDAQDADWR